MSTTTRRLWVAWALTWVPILATWYLGHRPAPTEAIPDPVATRSTWCPTPEDRKVAEEARTDDLLRKLRKIRGRVVFLGDDYATDPEGQARARDISDELLEIIANLELSTIPLSVPGERGDEPR